MFNRLERATRAHAANTARVASIEAQLTSAAAPAEGASFDDLVAADEAVRALRRKLVLAQGVAKDSEEQLKLARAEAAEKALDAEHTAEVKRTAADVKLLHKANTQAHELAATLADIAAGEARRKSINAVRGRRPFIESPEIGLRQRLDAGRPAITQKLKVYVDGDGKRVSDQAYDDQGRVYRRNDVRLVEVEDEIYPAIPPAPIPFEGLADATRLIGLEGQIWPPRE